MLKSFPQADNRPTSLDSKLFESRDDLYMREAAYAELDREVTPRETVCSWGLVFCTVPKSVIKTLSVINCSGIAAR